MRHLITVLSILFILGMVTRHGDKACTQTTSIHKIWKHKKSELITKTMTFAMDDFTVINLTDNDRLRFWDSNGKSRTISYKIVNNAITFPNKDIGNQIEFKISKLTENELVLIFHVVLQKKDDTKIEADVMKLTFEVQ